MLVWIAILLLVMISIYLYSRIEHFVDEEEPIPGYFDDTISYEPYEII